MHKKRFGQAHSRDLLKRNIMKFSLPFSEFYRIYYEFSKFEWFSGIYKLINEFWKKIKVWTVAPRGLARGLHVLARPCGLDGLAGPSRRGAHDTLSGRSWWCGFHRRHRRWGLLRWPTQAFVGGDRCTEQGGGERDSLRRWGSGEVVDDGGAVVLNGGDGALVGGGQPWQFLRHWSRGRRMRRGQNQGRKKARVELTGVGNQWRHLRTIWRGGVASGGQRP
jgi:hypothetical protein